ncbi:CopG family transcriptional regulator [Candidatus Ventrimonas sp. KK005]
MKKKKQQRFTPAAPRYKENCLNFVSLILNKSSKLQMADAAKSDRSRNELMCMALRYALDHLEFIPEAGE